MISTFKMTIEFKVVKTTTKKTYLQLFVKVIITCLSLLHLHCFKQQVSSASGDSNH